MLPIAPSKPSKRRQTCDPCRKAKIKVTVFPRLFSGYHKLTLLSSVTREFQYAGVVWQQVISAIMESVDVSKPFASKAFSVWRAVWHPVNVDTSADFL